jgi:hypothetical protein
MVATGLVDCRVAVVVLERFGFLCFAILGGGMACWCRGKAVLVQLFVRFESLVEALLLLLLAILGSLCLLLGRKRRLEALVVCCRRRRRVDATLQLMQGLMRFWCS